jgi:hypothetical protein
MPKSGPRELQAYHQQVLEKERKKTMSQTSLHETLDPETMNSRTAAVAKILAEGADNPPATPTLHAPHGSPNPPPQQPGTASNGNPPNEDGPKRTRMTVGKLTERYQQRVADFDDHILDAQQQIQSLEAQIGDWTSKRNFWREAIAEIAAD